jgi:hypothetical protein
MISASCDNQGSFRPLFARDDTSLALHLDPLWFDDRKASDGAGMSSKDMGAPSGGQIPYPDRPIGRSADKSVFAGCESPNATFVSVKRAKELSSDGGIDVYGMVVGSGDDAAMRE